MLGILVDVVRCTGCERCVSACVEANGGDRLRADVARSTARDGLAADRLSSVIGLGDGRFARKACMHCLEPSCVAACLVGGLTRTPDGAVVYDHAKCIGCHYCMLACPFHIPRYDWEDTHPYVRKCNLCQPRLARGEPPACVAACPHEALVFGERGELVATARARLAHDRRYLPRIWGESERGGTAVLYISDVDLAALDWPRSAAAATPIPHLTEPLIASTPFIGLGVASGLLGVSWIIRRRMRLAPGAAREPAAGPAPTDHRG